MILKSLVSYALISMNVRKMHIISYLLVCVNGCIFECVCVFMYVCGLFSLCVLFVRVCMYVSVSERMCVRKCLCERMCVCVVAVAYSDFQESICVC